MGITALAKYRARKACAKELASFPREELEREYRKLANPHPPSYDDIFGDSQSQASVEPMTAGINDDNASNSNSPRRSTTRIVKSPSREDLREASMTSSRRSSWSRQSAEIEEPVSPNLGQRATWIDETWVISPVKKRWARVLGCCALLDTEPANLKLEAGINRNRKNTIHWRSCSSISTREA